MVPMALGQATIRRHNSCVDFSFLLEKSKGNSRKLTRLNALFQRVADRHSGGIRQDKLRRILPSISNEFSAQRYEILLPKCGKNNGHPQDRKSRTEGERCTKSDRIISRGPFLAMFELESTSFINTLAANEKAAREKRHAQRRSGVNVGKDEKHKKKVGQSCSSPQSSPKIIKSTSSSPTSPQDISTVDTAVVGRARAHTAPCSSHFDVLSQTEGNFDDGASTPSLVSPDLTSSLSASPSPRQETVVLESPKSSPTLRTSHRQNSNKPKHFTFDSDVKCRSLLEEGSHELSSVIPPDLRDNKSKKSRRTRSKESQRMSASAHSSRGKSRSSTKQRKRSQRVDDWTAKDTELQNARDETIYFLQRKNFSRNIGAEQAPQPGSEINAMPGNGGEEVPDLEAVTSYGSTSSSESTYGAQSDYDGTYGSAIAMYPSPYFAYCEDSGDFTPGSFLPRHTRESASSSPHLTGIETCSFLSSVASFVRDLFSPPKRTTNILALTSQGYYYYPTTPMSAVSTNRTHPDRMG